MSERGTTLLRRIGRVAGWAAVLVASGVLLIPARGADDEAETARQKRWEKFYAEQARGQEFFADAERTQKLNLEPMPVYTFAGTEGGGGSTFVWTRDGRPEIVGAIFSAFWSGGRHVLHEYHSLSPDILHPANPNWVPKSGLPRHDLTGAEAPAKTAAGRLIQLRQLAREFSAYSTDDDGQRWEMRLLPRPLYRYDVKTGPVIDGALFGFVTTKSTDPEIFLVIEARQEPDGPRWQYALARFSHHSLHVDRAGKEVWSALIGPDNATHDNSEHTYHVFETQWTEPAE